MLRYLSKVSHRVLISGGCGFIGANLAAHLLANTEVHVTLYDNLSREGSEANLAWLKQQAAPGRLVFIRGDVRNSVAVTDAVSQADEVYHFAARCPSGAESRADFEVNVTGTLNMLDASRHSRKKPMVFFASVSGIYGLLNSVAVEPAGDRYLPVDRSFRGISEFTPIDFQAAYESSMAAADRLMREYARNHGVRTVVLRLDTVAGPRQFGGEQQGWVSKIVRAVLAGKPVPVTGNGLQVHDVLHVSDLVDAITAARAYIGVTAGKVYNLGGGMSHAFSVNEVVHLAERVCYRQAQLQYMPARASQPPFYAADSWAFLVDTGWMARRSVEQAVRDLAAFWRANEAQDEHQLPGFAETLTRAA